MDCQIQQMINFWKNDFKCKLLFEELFKELSVAGEYQENYFNREDSENYFNNIQSVAAYCAAVSALIRGMLLDASNYEDRAIGYISVLEKDPHFSVLPLPESMILKEENLTIGQQVYRDTMLIGWQIAYSCSIPISIGELVWRLLVSYLAKYETEDSILPKIKTCLICNQEIIKVSLADEDEDEQEMKNKNRNMKSETGYPKTGIAVMVLKDGKVLLGKRKNAHGVGDYAFPGGKLEWWESFEECAKREVREETGIEISNIRFLRLLNFKFYDKHFVDVGLLVDWKNGQPKVLEPEKCDGWEWYGLDNLPDPLFKGCASCIEAHKTGKNYFDM